MRHFVLSKARPLGLLIALALSAVPALASAPNIIFVMTDDQGPWAWGGGGHPDARTPNIDRLRSEGVHLANFFVTTPVCSPARGSVVSSRYPLEFGFADVLGDTSGDTRGLDPALPAWPRELQRAGYRTGLIGKWHLGTEDRYFPKNFGYDYFTGWRHGASVSKDPEVEFDDGTRVVEGYTSDILGDLALDFIAKDTDTPFLLSLHFWAPHANSNKTADGDRTWMPLNDLDWDVFKDLKPTLPEPRDPDLDLPRAERMTREYLASVHSVDRNVGRILALLDERGLAENTIVVFTSDHGFNMAHHGIWHKGNGLWLLKNKQGNRANLWDTSLRAPAIIRWPAAIAPGSTITQTTSNLDWFPSLLSLAGVPMPEGAVIRGQNFAPLLRGESAPWNDDFFIQYDQRLSLPGSANLRGYRTTEWKLVRDFRNAGKDELYHLPVDPGETTNLINEPVVAAELQSLDQALRIAMERVNDPALALPAPH